MSGFTRLASMVEGYSAMVWTGLSCTGRFGVEITRFYSDVRVILLVCCLFSLFSNRTISCFLPPSDRVVTGASNLSSARTVKVLRCLVLIGGVIRGARLAASIVSLSSSDFDPKGK